MTDPARGGVTRSKWFWAIVLVVLAVFASFWFARSLGGPVKDEPGQPQAQSSEWATQPAGAAVPVSLPTTPLKNVEEEPRDAADGTDKETE